jgi:hypothetical protein
VTVRLYFDEDTVRHALVEALRKRRVDILTPLDVGMIQKADEEQLEFAAAQSRTLYTFNMGDFCPFHAQWLGVNRDHAGIIVARQQQYSVGEQLRRLLKLIGTRSQVDMCNRLEFLSDWN